MKGRKIQESWLPRNKFTDSQANSTRHATLRSPPAWLTSSRSSRVADNAREGDDQNVRELDETIHRAVRGVGRERRRVPAHEGGQRREGARDCRRNGEAHQHRAQRLSQREVQSQQRRKHGVQQRIAHSGQQDDERKFDGDEQRLFRRTPPAHRRAIAAGADQDDGQLAAQPKRIAAMQPALQRFRFATQQRGKFVIRGTGRPGIHAGLM